MADDEDYPLLRAEAYGPSQGEFTHDTLYGPLGELADNDIAVSPDQLSRYPLGSTWDAVDESGNVVQPGVRVADYSYKSPGNPNSNTMEFWNGQDVGHVRLVPAGKSWPAQEDENLSDQEVHDKYLSYLPDYSGQQEAPPSQPVPQEADKQISPLENLRQEFPGMAKLTDDQVTGKLQHVFPDVAMDKLSVYAKQPDGYKLIRDELNRVLTPLEKIKKYYPAITKGKNDDQIIEWMHDHWEPKTPLDQFKEKVNPPPPVINALKLGLMAGAQQTYGKWEQMPKAGTDVLDGLYKAAGVYGWEKSADSWLKQNVPAYGAANDYFVKFVNDLNSRGKEFEKQADQAQAAIPETAEGQVASTLGEVAGSIPDIAVSFGLGGTGKAAALFGMAYEGTSAYGHAVENQQKNALQQGVSAAGFRGFAQYLMNTGQGRIVTGIENSVAGATEEEVQKWLRGEPNDITKDGKTAILWFLMGLLTGGKRPQGEYKAPATEPETIEPGIPPKEAPKFTEAQLKGEAVINPSGRPEQPTEEHQLTFTFDHHAPPVAEELNKAQEYHQNGDTDRASAHIDKAIALMPKEQVSALATQAVDKVKELAASSADVVAKPKPGSSTDDFNDYYFAGIPFSLKAIRDSFKEITGIGKRDPELKETFKQIVRSQEAASKQRQVRVIADIARANDVLDKLKNGDQSEVRERTFGKYTEAERIQQFIDYQEGKKLKDPTADWIYERVYRPAYDFLDRMEAHYGIEHETRKNYYKQLFLHPLDEQTRLREDVRKQAGGPSYTKEREMTYREHIERGDKPVTTNPERLLQMRWRESELAIQKIQDMMQLEEQGGAYETNRTDIPPRVKNQRWGIQPTANGKNFYVHPDLNPILNNKFRSLDLYRTTASPYFKFLGAIKGTTAGLLSWSGFHPGHELDIMTSDLSATAYQLRKAKKMTWESAMNEALNWVPSIGIPGVAALPSPSSVFQGVRMSIKYRDVVNAMKGLVDKKDITPEIRRDMRDLKDIGISIQVNQERMMQFSEGLRDMLTPHIRDAQDGHLISMGAKSLGMLYKGATASPFTKWWFGTVQPRLKVASALTRRDALLAIRPDLLKASKRGELLREYGKINRDVEGRFGEMDYDNLLWPKWVKQVGTTHLLSLGWTIGMIRTMGDGLIDMTKNVAHMDEIWAKSKNMREFERNMVTNRMAFETAYMGRGVLTGLAIAYFVGRVSPTLWDAFYPRVGKNPDGSDKRVNMQFFTKDIPSFFEYSKQEGSLLGGFVRMGLNKMNPAAMTAWQAMTNKDYMGRPIGDLPAQIAYFLWNSSVPMSMQNIAKTGMTPQNFMEMSTKHLGDIIMDLLGYTPSARWTQRSPIENEIIQESFAKPGAELSNARDEYRQAYLTHDPEGMRASKEKLKALKATDRSIKNIEKDAHLSTAQKAWKHLPNAKKAEMMQKMSPEERAEWQKLSPHARISQ